MTEHKETGSTDWVKAIADIFLLQQKVWSGKVSEKQLNQEVEHKLSEFDGSDHAEMFYFFIRSYLDNINIGRFQSVSLPVSDYLAKMINLLTMHESVLKSEVYKYFALSGNNESDKYSYVIIEPTQDPITNTILNTFPFIFEHRFNFSNAPKNPKWIVQAFVYENNNGVEKSGLWMSSMGKKYNPRKINK